MRTMVFFTDSLGREFVLFLSKGRPAVAVAGEEWDYDQEADARELTDEVRDCRTLEDAAEMLGI